MILEHNGKRPLEIGYRQATFSDDKRHRYTLTERIAHHGAMMDLVIVWLMCNPSTADAFVLDPTVTRCRNFSMSWGFDVYEVVNLFSLRTPYPDEVRDAALTAGGRSARWTSPIIRRAIGSDARNDAAITAAATRADRLMLAYGQMEFTRERGREILRILDTHQPQPPMFTLGVSKGGYPKHPLARGKAAILTTQKAIPW